MTEDQELRVTRPVVDGEVEAFEDLATGLAFSVRESFLHLFTMAGNSMGPTLKQWEKSSSAKTATATANQAATTSSPSSTPAESYQELGSDSSRRRRARRQA